LKDAVFVYVGDFGATPISDITLAAYDVEFLKNGDKKWRLSSKKRANVKRMYADLEAAQRYFWKRNEDRDVL